MIENRASQIVVVAAIFLALTWISTLLRCFVRIRIVKQFSSDDWFALASLLTLTVFQIFVLWGVIYGSGQHISNLPPTNIPKALKQWYFAEIFYDIATTLTKFTVGIFLLRLSVKPVHIWIIRLVLGIIALYATAYLGLIIFQCQPIDLYWLRFTGVTAGHCADNIVILVPTYVHTALNAVADWTLGLLPLFIIKDLDLNLRTKVTAAIILALGAIGSIASLIRLKYISSLVQPDFLYAATDVAIWSIVEPGMGVTAASLATLRPLFGAFLTHTRLFASSAKTSNSRPSQTSTSRWTTGEKEVSTVLTVENIIELSDYRQSRNPEFLRQDPRREEEETVMRERALGRIIQSQAHADEEEAEMRRKVMARNKPVSWGRTMRPRERRRSISSNMGTVESRGREAAEFSLV